VAAAGIADRVEVPGWVGPDAIERQLAESDVLVLPSFVENLPMSVIEGMAAGLAVVTTPVGATRDIIEHGVTGLFVPPGDSDALAQALWALIDDRALRQRLGQAARAFHREHLDSGVYLQRLLALWRAAAGDRAARA
jgi:glycosyltransferase involved in cell wall biosynthesis